MDDEGEGKSAQAYQVLGFLMLTKKGKNASDAEQIRALDYFADSAKFDEDFLPWPK